MKRKITYKQAGVDIAKADGLIKKNKTLISSTRIKGAIGSIGGFGGFFDPARTGIKDPLMVASTDGVGTKLKIAQIAGKHDTVGVDLVAMCVNDILCSGAQPLLFLDYFAAGKLDEKIWGECIKGIVKGCKSAGCALLGGETAEMPDMYPAGEYDLAGFAVGMVDRKKVIDGRKIKQGDVIIGVASSGLHSNGYSLIRKLFSARELAERKKDFLKPTTIYVQSVMYLLQRVDIRGIAHITGGGIVDNIPRVLPGKTVAVIDTRSWPRTRFFRQIAERAALGTGELYKTFNMGIGMALILPAEQSARARKILKERFRLKSWEIGYVERGRRGIQLQ